MTKYLIRVARGEEDRGYQNNIDDEDNNNKRERKKREREKESEITELARQRL
jgi:hypothetical protein